MEFAILAGGLLSLAVVIYVILGFCVDLIVPNLSTELEEKLGAGLAGHFTSEKLLETESRRVQLLVDRLEENCTPLPYRVQVHVLKQDVVNAAALPGGHLILYSGLLEKMGSENELSFVLGHEIGHMANRDHLRGLGRGLVLMTASALLFGADNSINGLISKGLELTELNFSRSQEAKADEYGLQAVDCLYGHIGGAVDFFSKLPPDADPGWLGHYFASHPENQDRIERLQQFAEMNGYVSGSTVPLPPTLQGK